MPKDLRVGIKLGRFEIVLIKFTFFCFFFLIFKELHTVVWLKLVICLQVDELKISNLATARAQHRDWWTTDWGILVDVGVDPLSSVFSCMPSASTRQLSQQPQAPAGQLWSTRWSIQSSTRKCLRHAVPQVWLKVRKMWEKNSIATFGSTHDYRNCCIVHHVAQMSEWHSTKLWFPLSNFPPVPGRRWLIF